MNKKTNPIIEEILDNKVFKKCENPTWCALKTFEGRESKSIKDLIALMNRYDVADLLVESFTPKTKTKIFKDGEYIEKFESFHPGYMYVAFDIESLDELTDVSLFLLKDRQKICTIKPEEIEELKQRAKEQDENPEVFFGIKEGDRIKVKEGGYKDMCGVLVSLDPETEKVKVKLSIFEREVPVELLLNQLELDK